MADIMGGLLSNWGKWTGDPDRDGAIQQGLLSAGLSLMGSRGNLAQGLGQAGMQGMQTYQQQMAQQVPNKLAQLQLQNAQAEAERRKSMASLAQQYARPPGADNRDAGQEQGFDYGGYANALAQVDPMQALQLQGALRRDAPAPVNVSAGSSLVDPRTGKVLYTSPTTGAPTELSRLLGEMNQLPIGDPRRKMFMDAITKQTTHSPQVQVSYGQPVAGVDAKGNSVFFQPSRDGTSPPAIVQGVKPAPQNRDTKLPAELQRMQIAGDSMVGLLDEYEKLLKQHNPRDPLTQANPTVRADIQAVKRNLELQFKELQALGALAGPDVEIMRQALADPFTMQGAFYGREGLLAQTKRARDLVQNRKDAVLRSQGQSPQGAQGGAPAATLKYNPATGKVE